MGLKVSDCCIRRRSISELILHLIDCFCRNGALYIWLPRGSTSKACEVWYFLSVYSRQLRHFSAETAPADFATDIDDEVLMTYTGRFIIEIRGVMQFFYMWRIVRLANPIKLFAQIQRDASLHFVGVWSSALTNKVWERKVKEISQYRSLIMAMPSFLAQDSRNNDLLSKKPLVWWGGKIMYLADGLDPVPFNV